MNTTSYQTRRHLLALLVASLLVAARSPWAAAAAHEFTLPLDHGQVRISELTSVLCRELDLPAVKLPLGRIGVSGQDRDRLINALNGSLGDGLNVRVVRDTLVLHIDRDRLPRDCDAAKRSVRLFTALEAPEATAAQRRLFGLHLPAKLDRHRPLIVLIHGLECDCDMWGSMQRLLIQSGYQVALFGYPGAGPIAEDAEMLTNEMSSFRQTYPDVRVDIIAHSMGGLVARAYIEGSDYRGGVDRLILLATPNAGSSWATCRTALALLAIQQHYHQWRDNPDWRATWIITDGLGEAGRDLRPGSPFLKTLNDRPRRDGVRYTIVAGDLPPTSEIGGAAIRKSTSWVPAKVAGWWGIRQCEAKIDQWAASVGHHTGDGDGPVTLKSAHLYGVDDFVVVHAGHTDIAMTEHPIAWEVVRDRLEK